ncbi:eukaryotic translation elongation factor 1 delta b (guanine nucleotide exchange protein) isoform X1 [Electrophorus electricus]|uniref:eukaryotic translation elongation factor 1 delta b (guanine nucleotide exchange protein) isoform X1 n=2 Tax=Electrophorus electricus TaxID=8005 RepID=UPI0015CFFE26|nr:eukaryotic translation elongation factor 1 delta b (guanine nucleotide exchange protein) isoform X1 [Electrophorus electricus]
MPQRSLVNCDVDQPKISASRSDCVTAEVTAGHLSSGVTQDLLSECAAVWFDCSVYERAESQYYTRLQERQNGTASPASTWNSASQRNKGACHHGDQEACHHMVQTVWVNKPLFDQAESHFVAQHPKQGNSLNTPSFLQLLPNSPSSNALYDEGYLSQTPTPHTPASRPINGLPFLPALLQGVWLQKSLYDRAEASFYQNLYCENELHCKPIAVSEQQADLENMKGTLPKEAKHDQAEEEKPRDAVKKESGTFWCHFLHADSERVWLDRSRYMEAETRFYETIATKTSQTAIGHFSSSLKMPGVDFLAHERIWFDKPRYDEAERRFYERKNGPAPPAQQDSGANSILQDIARARENIQKSLAGLKTTLRPTRSSAHKPQNPSHSATTAGSSSAEQGELLTRMKNLELENQSLHKVVEELRSALSKLESRVYILEKRPVTPAPAVNGTAPNKTPPAHPAKNEDEDQEEDDFDLFGSDDEVDEEAERIKEQRLQEYAAKKAKKPALIAKSSILLDVKPWDDETDMAKLEECVRSVKVDGLLWGASKLVPVGYGIKKLQINCVVEDDKVGTDLLEEEITKFEDYVQSVDVAAFNKI